MSRVHVFFFLMAALSSVCLGATLMQISVSQNSLEKNAVTSEMTPSCRKLVEKFAQESRNVIAKKIYEDAYRKSFNGDPHAKEAASCARILLLGQENWKIGPEQLSH